MNFSMMFPLSQQQRQTRCRMLAAKLTDQAGLSVFLDIWNLVPGDPCQEDFPIQG